nr:DUF4352 domain-containing protein [Paenibacillus bovis]
MKKLWLGVFAAALLLTGCGDDKDSKASGDDVAKEKEVVENKEFEPKEVKVSMGEPMDVVVHNMREKTVMDHYEITFDNFRMVSDISKNKRDNEENNYLAIDVTVTNKGEKDSSNSFFVANNIKFYNENGAEIYTYEIVFTDEEVFKDATLRPGGTNSGTLYMIVPKDETVKEIIFQEAFLKLTLSDKFIFDISI